MNTEFPVILGFDMETDVGSWTPFYEGLLHGTPLVLNSLREHGATGTFFFVGSAAQAHPGVVRLVQAAGHEVGCHALYHETVGDQLFPIPGMTPLLAHEVQPRLALATRLVSEAAGGAPMRSFRAPRLFGSSKMIQALADLGYIADASLPMYAFPDRLAPYHPSHTDWTKPGDMKLWEFPNFADVAMASSDPLGRDRDQWPLFRTASAAALLVRIDAFLAHVRNRGIPPVLTFYFHPWEFWPMPQGPIHFGEGAVLPDPFLVSNCGGYALQQFGLLLSGLRERGARFTTCAAYAGDRLAA
jgi:peptidoglycan/xylan/chitin deacetylase (PgdA/CDA1 family)